MLSTTSATNILNSYIQAYPPFLLSSYRKNNRLSIFPSGTNSRFLHILSAYPVVIGSRIFCVDPTCNCDKYNTCFNIIVIGTSPHFFSSSNGFGEPFLFFIFVVTRYPIIVNAISHFRIFNNSIFNDCKF